eukprot:SAG31_NODE_30546_length_379_cov_1.107143_1_plen_35_part_10
MAGSPCAEVPGRLQLNLIFLKFRIKFRIKFKFRMD